MNRTSHLRLVCLISILGAATVAAQQQAPQTKPEESRAITGRVVSEAGQALSGVNVAAVHSGGAAGQRTSSDNEGYFKLQGLDAGLYRLFASLPGYVSQTPQTDPNTTGTLYRPGDSASLTLVKGGVIAGFVTNANGEPVVQVTIRAFRVRDAEGNKLRTATSPEPKLADDRGYYRIYGLQPGSYIVVAGGQSQYFGMVNPFANDAPTYAPASTRDTAAEIIVRSDQEAEVDIRYRGEPGHVISGKVTGALPPVPFNATINLSDVETRSTITNAPVIGEERAFQLTGVSDGEYEIAAAGGGALNSDMVASGPRRVTVKGADVTGLELLLAPMGSISGRIVIEPDPKLNCGRRRDNIMRETAVTSRRERPDEKSDRKDPKDQQTEVTESAYFPVSSESVPNEKGEITFRNLFPATYRLEVRPLAAGWYVRELSLVSPDQRALSRTSGTNVAMNGIKISAGAKVTGVTIAIAEGGASLRGRVTAAVEGQTLPPNLRLYLVPAERENRENVLRFFEGTVADDGTFALGNLAPGRYWIIAQPAESMDPYTVKSIRTDSALRAKIMREAEAIKKEIAFKPCERTVDYEVPFSPKPSQ